MHGSDEVDALVICPHISTFSFVMNKIQIKFHETLKIVRSFSEKMLKIC
jgi:hypothetical protein